MPVEFVVLDNSCHFPSYTNDVTSCLSFFTTSAFFNYHSHDKNDFYFLLLDVSPDGKSNRILARSCFYLSSATHYVSPLNSTFGGFDLAEDINSDHIKYFISSVLSHLNSFATSSISLRLAPSYLFSSSSYNHTLLTYSENGFSFAFPDISHHLPVTTMEFSSSLNRASRRALSKCNSKSYRFSRLNSEYIVELYSIISANRSSKGFSLSLPLDELSRQISVFGEHYLLFGVYNECNSLCASAVCVRTFSNVLYVLYWADLPSECSFSPIPFLANGLYEYCQNNGFRVLDVGRSSLKVSVIPDYAGSRNHLVVNPLSSGHSISSQCLTKGPPWCIVSRCKSKHLADVAQW